MDDFPGAAPAPAREPVHEPLFEPVREPAFEPAFEPSPPPIQYAPTQTVAAPSAPAEVTYEPPPPPPPAPREEYRAPARAEESSRNDPPLDTAGARTLPAHLQTVKHTVHEQIIEQMDQAELAELDERSARSLVRHAAAELLQADHVQGIGGYRDTLLDEIADEVLGLGPLEPLLRDDSITEIMVNSPDLVFIERAGRIYRAQQAFRNEEHLVRVIDRIVSPLGRHVDEASPMVDARLADGTRVNVIGPPASPRGMKLTLRKFMRARLHAEDLVRRGTLSADALAFLRRVVEMKRNVIVSGGTGSGKTTLLNVLSSFIGETERIVTVEDPLELQLQQANVIALEARPATAEGSKPITQRELVRNSLRMRPDRIIVGEVRGGEAFDMLQAMNTGHEGSLSTVHANTPRDALSRIENMVLMAGFDLPSSAIREQIASAVHLIVQVARMNDGSRRVTHITEVVGMDGGVITLQDLFALSAVGTDGAGGVVWELASTGLPSRFAKRGGPQGGVDFGAPHPSHVGTGAAVPVA